MQHMILIRSLSEIYAQNHSHYLNILKSTKSFIQGSDPLYEIFLDVEKSFRQAGKLSIHKKEHTKIKIKQTASYKNSNNLQTSSDMNYSALYDNLNFPMSPMDYIISLQSYYWTCELVDSQVPSFNNNSNHYECRYMLETPLNYYSACL